MTMHTKTSLITRLRELAAMNDGERSVEDTATRTDACGDAMRAAAEMLSVDANPMPIEPRHRGDAVAEAYVYLERHSYHVKLLATGAVEISVDGVVAGRGSFTGRSIDQCSGMLPSSVYAELDDALARDLEHRGLVVMQRADGGRAVVKLAEPMGGAT